MGRVAGVALTLFLTVVTLVVLPVHSSEAVIRQHNHNAESVQSRNLLRKAWRPNIIPTFRKQLMHTILKPQHPGPIAPSKPAVRQPGCKRMMWFTALGVREDGNVSEAYASFIVPALLSALREAPSLEPHLIYDGPGNPPIVQWWKTMGGIVHYHHLAFYDMLAAVSKPPYHNQGFIGLAGAFLRFDIPLVLESYPVPDDIDKEYVLYTDVDSMFLKDIDSCSFPANPIFSMGPEEQKGKIVNAGVMHINLAGWKHHRQPLIEWGQRHHWPMVQPILLGYFANRTDGARMQLMEDRFNWKGYWGKNDDAVIIHFHGPKPGVCLECYVFHKDDIKYCTDKYHHCDMYKHFWKYWAPDNGTYFVEIMKTFYFYVGMATATMI